MKGNSTAVKLGFSEVELSELVADEYLVVSKAALKASFEVVCLVA
jgi:hypothetical protein